MAVRVLRRCLADVDDGPLIPEIAIAAFDRRAIDRLLGPVVRLAGGEGQRLAELGRRERVDAVEPHVGDDRAWSLGHLEPHRHRHAQIGHRQGRHPRRDPDRGEPLHAVQLGQRRGHGGDAGFDERLAGLELEQRLDLGGGQLRHAVDGERLEHVQRPLPHREGDDQLAAVAPARGLHLGLAIALGPQVELDVAAGILDHFFVHRADLLDRHQGAAPRRRQRISGELDAHPIAQRHPHHDVGHRRSGLAHARSR